MKTLGQGLSALFTACGFIVACSRTTELSPFQYIPSVNSVRDRGASPSSYRVLHSFGKGTDGTYPAGSLIDVGGTLYGTTAWGGLFGGGTVFSITTDGTEKVLHSFGDGNDGANPGASLVDVDGTLYGTTEAGGRYGVCFHGFPGCGTVFQITADGREKVLHSFGNETDGAGPVASLIDVDGTLYGTTELGGRYRGCGFLYPSSCGTVFSITTNGKEKVLHNFGKGNDGFSPKASLIDVRGTLYGTTSGGGGDGCSSYGCGTVFSLTTNGEEKVVHNFGKGSDGRFPLAGLIAVRGTLYGTTDQGGLGGGTVFSITTDGREKVLHRFRYRLDGENPGTLIDVDGTLYGMVYSGGRYDRCDQSGCGRVFQMTTDGVEKVLHNFGQGTDGKNPVSLYYKSGTFFGTTLSGGAYALRTGGGGVVFSLTP